MQLRNVAEMQLLNDAELLEVEKFLVLAVATVEPQSLTHSQGLSDSEITQRWVFKIHIIFFTKEKNLSDSEIIIKSKPENQRRLLV